ncbi:riboflavin synthase [Treponema sp.]|uniref:riboflavin synthase n=1 Tax=Treponema sp. TaxID=166 RepID=UPI00298E09B5|nr:riboflavin synthase [Treponema sp.]MCQ2240502.1 riboflavin synthase [Treponema sp.]
MFTGIIETTGKIKSISRGTKSLTLSVQAEFDSGLVLGESIAVNGTCLTVTDFGENWFCADVTPETFSRTSLGQLHTDSIVNLERAMKADGRFGGHIVSGHIDGTARFLSFSKEENAVNVSVVMESSLGEYMIEKGSVAIDGISLTIARVKKDGSDYIISVAVIPHTWEHTTLAKKKSGDIVNIECDVIGKYVRHFVSLKDAPKDMGAYMDFESYH